MVNTTIHKISAFLSKDIIIFLIMSLLNFSFINYDWEKDIKSRDRVHKNISDIFK